MMSESWPSQPPRPSDSESRPGHDPVTVTFLAPQAHPTPLWLGSFALAVHAHAHARTHANTSPRTHAHTSPRAHTHHATHTHTHTHTRREVPESIPPSASSPVVLPPSRSLPSPLPSPSSSQSGSLPPILSEWLSLEEPQASPNRSSNFPSLSLPPSLQ